MAEAQAPHSLLAKTLELAERHSMRQRTVKVETDRAPDLGDVYVLEATRDYPVEWVLVAHDPADEHRFLAVPADGSPLVGSADVAVSEDALFGTLKLRCRFGAWVESGTLDPNRRVGIVAESDVTRARQKWLHLGEGKALGSLLEREVDEDPEYRDWVEQILLPAHRLLADGPAAKVTAQAEPSGGMESPVVVAMEEHRRRFGLRRRGFVVGVAAVLGAVVLGLIFQLGRLEGRIYEPVLVRSLRLSELSFRDLDRPGDVLVVETAASHWSFFLLLPDSANRPEAYRLRLLEKSSGRVVWESDAQSPDSELLLVLPRQRVPVGEYNLELYGSTREGAESLLAVREIRFEVAG